MHTDILIEKRENLYYKSWPGVKTHPFLTLEGLDFKYNGDNMLASMSVGLINVHTAPAYKEMLYDPLKRCVGYTTYAGKSVDKFDERLPSFIKLLVKTSVSTGYLFSDTKISNIIDYNGKLSLIDLDFTPIKIDHDLDGKDKLKWQHMIHFGQENFYFDQLIAQGII